MGWKGAHRSVPRRRLLFAQNKGTPSGVVEILLPSSYSTVRTRWGSRLSSLFAYCKPFALQVFNWKHSLQFCDTVMADDSGLDGRRRVKSAMRRRGYIQGMPEFSSSSSSNSGSIQLFNTHIPFPVPILESQLRENHSKAPTKLHISSSTLLEAATVEAHRWIHIGYLWHTVVTLWYCLYYSTGTEYVVKNKICQMEHLITTSKASCI